MDVVQEVLRQAPSVATEQQAKDALALSNDNVGDAIALLWGQKQATKVDKLWLECEESHKIKELRDICAEFERERISKT